MEDTEMSDFVTDKTVAAVFLAVLISSGTGPIFRLLGYTHPGISIIGALVGAIIAVYEAREVQQRIKEAKDKALLGTGFAPGFGG